MNANKSKMFYIGVHLRFLFLLTLVRVGWVERSATHQYHGSYAAAHLI